MKKITLLAAAALLLGSVGHGLAQSSSSSPGNSGSTPGHQMQEKGSVPGSPGASGYAPGHNKDADDKTTVKRGTTGSGAGDMTKDKDDMKKGGMK